MSCPTSYLHSVLNNNDMMMMIIIMIMVTIMMIIIVIKTTIITIINHLAKMPSLTINMSGSKSASHNTGSYYS